VTDNQYGQMIINTEESHDEFPRSEVPFRGHVNTQ